MKYRTPLARVRGLGSAKSGTHHFWAQRVTAVAMVPLGLWLLVTIATLTGSSYESAVATLSSPLATVLGIALTVAAFYHAYLGLQVVVEDYIHGHGAKIAILLVVKFACVLLAAVAIVALLQIALQG